MKKIAIVTGANGGMGYEEAKEALLQGYHTIMACYCPSKSEARRQQMIEETGCSDVEILGLDLSNLQSVRNFADQIKAKFDHIDVLMNNAGTLETGLHTTVDGLERTVSVNYVGPYLLTRLLLPLMSKGSRIVNMSSCTYMLGKLQFPEFFHKGRKGFWQRILVYSNTKLAITLFTLDLAKRVKGQGVTVNAADPGVVNTKIIHLQNTIIDPLADVFFRPLIRTPRQGADTAIRLMFDKEKEGQTGTFCRSNKIVKLGDRYVHHKQMQTLWDETEKIVQKFLA
ncbi:MAG: SDR family NAD(P)-dependent oxidoreductase [Bacteroidaceae bacterium]|nr:SDR family NAD(P)-dependent oxidoreductase [Bacteroidaceae bacterium]